jgi:hypothetical protein
VTARPPRRYHTRQSPKASRPAPARSVTASWK